MADIRKISLIGMGAIGCVYGSKLLDALPDKNIQVIADAGRIERYQKNGFLINGKRYDFPYALPDGQTEPSDLIIVSVKANQLPQAIQDMRRHVGGQTIILSLLNGITSEEIIGETYGMDKILYAMCNGVDANRIGNHTHFTNYGKIFFGEKTNKTYSEKVKAVKALFDQAELPYDIPENMIHTLWYKFMINVGINQASAVTRGQYKIFQTVEEARELMESAMREVIRLSQKTGANLTEDDLKRWYGILYNVYPESRTSMLQDIEAGRETEVEIFSGLVCDLGKKYGVATPVNQTLYFIIKTVEAIQKQAGKASLA